MTEISLRERVTVNSMKDFDGFYLIPGNNEREIEYRFFKFHDDKSLGDKVDGTDVGDMYHVAFFKQKKDGDVEFDDCFEAIFADPVVYSKNLYGMNIFGTFLKKRENSPEWWDDYLKSVLGRVMIEKMKFYAESIANSK